MRRPIGHWRRISASAIPRKSKSTPETMSWLAGIDPRARDVNKRWDRCGSKFVAVCP